MDELKNTPQGSPDGQEDMEEVFRILDKLEKRDQAERAVADAKKAAEAEKAAKEGLLESTPAADDKEQLAREQQAAAYDLADLLIDPFEVDYEEDEYAPPHRARRRAQPQPMEDEDEALPPVPARRNPFAVIWEGFRANLPARGDPPGALVRKLTFLLALVVLIVSLGYILMDVVVLPMQNSQMYSELEEVYDPENSDVITEGNYPEGMLASFRELYDRNDEVRGWISYHATGKKDFLNIEYPVMFAGDNDKYLTVDFDEKKNKNGALFFDMNNRLETATDENRSLIIYGHNMASGQMFAGLNKFIGSVGNARAAAQLTMSTLYENSTYQVFAVLITDEDEIARWYFNTRRTQFAGDADFLNFVQQLRDRSLFDYPVEVSADDELLVLSTCTAKSTSKIKDGRLVVVARKMQTGDAATDTTQIQRNNDVIMPRSWYTNQGLALHEYYGGDHAGITTTTTKGITTSSGLSWPAQGSGTETTGTSGTETTITGATGGNTMSGVGGTTPTGRQPGGSTTAGSGPVTAPPTNTSAGSTTATAAPSVPATEGGDTTVATGGGETTPSSEATETTATQTEETTTAAEPAETTAAEEPTDTTQAETEPTQAPVDAGGEEQP